jgi:hypothetical protein
VHFFVNGPNSAQTASGEGGGVRGGTLPNENASKQSVSLNQIMDFFSKDVFVYLSCYRTEKREPRAEREGLGGGPLCQTEMRQKRVSP